MNHPSLVQQKKLKKFKLCISSNDGLDLRSAEGKRYFKFEYHICDNVFSEKRSKTMIFQVFAIIKHQEIMPIRQIEKDSFNAIAMD